jgi:uncharacterized repeat protein (TIGR03803 family)
VTSGRECIRVLVDNSFTEEQILKFKFSSPTSLFVAICLFSLISLESQPAHAQQATETILYGGFSSATGEYPCDFGSLVMDASGNLYGTTLAGGTSGVGTVFELVNSSGTYSEKVLYSFTNSGGDGLYLYPYAGVIMDASGNLYGTTELGGTSGWGTVFELVNSSGSYSEKVLHSFTNSGGDGLAPYAGLIMDASGNLYGTTYEGGTSGVGTVFELVNSSGSYSEKVLHSFTNSGGDGLYPYAGVIMDASGNLYGTTYEGGNSGYGTVFELVNSSGTYSEKVLHSFASSGPDGAYTQAGLIMDASGNLYGTTLAGGTSGVGTVFEVTNATALSVSSNPSPSNYGQPVTFTATISDAFGNVKKRSTRKAVRPQVVTGTVTWSANTGCGTTSMTSGTATCTTSILPVGDDTVTANYSGNHNAASGSISQTVDQATTSINVTAVSPSSEAYGQDAPATITAVLSWSGSGAAPTAANVIIGGNGNGTYGITSCGSPSGDTMTCAATYTPNTNDTVGTYTETATFSGDSNYTGSISPQSGNFAIAQAGSGTITVSSSQNPSAYGQSVTFTATIPGQYGAIRRNGKVRSQVVTGTVTWSSNTGCGTTPVTSGTPGTTTCMTSSLSVGSDTVTASYSGDSNHNPGSGSTSQTVSQATTSISVTNVNPSSEDYGSTALVTISATLSWSGSGTAPTAADVTISGSGLSGSFGTTSCGAPSGGTISCSNTYTPSGNDVPGSYTMSASFSGDTNYSASGSAQTNNFFINSAISTTSVSSSMNPSNSGQSVTFTASINGENGNVKGRKTRKGVKSQVVTGTVAWSANTGCGTTPVTPGNPGVATCTTSSLPVGTDTITASYEGDRNHSGSTGTLSGGQTVNQAVTSINVTSVVAASESYGQNQPITITAVLSWTGNGAAPTASAVSIGGNGPSGTYGTTNCGAPSGDAMTCTNTYVPTAADAVGLYTETAAFAGDGIYSGSNSLQTNNFAITQASAGTVVTSNLNPSSYGQAVTFTVTISGQNGEVKGRRLSGRRGAKSEDVTGTVAWSANTGCGTTPVTSGNPGTAMCTTSSLPVGNNPIAATYSGDGNHSGSTGTLSGGQTVNQASQTITFTTPPPTTAGYNTSFTVVATASSGLPVTYTSSGVCTNSGATYTIKAAKGTCSVQVNQSGNSNYLPAPTLTANVTATKATPVASFTGAPASAVYGATFTVTATANSGITPTITASGACTISGTTVTMTTGTGTCTMTAKWAANADYNALSLTQKTKAEPLTPEVSFTGAPASAANGTMFTVTATSNESGSHASVPTITASGACTAGAVSNNGPGSYEATITITKNTGTCTTTAKWAKTIEYAAETLTQKTTAQK